MEQGVVQPALAEGEEPVGTVGDGEDLSVAVLPSQLPELGRLPVEGVASSEGRRDRRRRGDGHHQALPVSARTTDGQGLIRQGAGHAELPSTPGALCLDLAHPGQGLAGIAQPPFGGTLEPCIDPGVQLAHEAFDHEGRHHLLDRPVGVRVPVLGLTPCRGHLGMRAGHLARVEHADRMHGAAGPGGHHDRRVGIDPVRPGAQRLGQGEHRAAILQPPRGVDRADQEPRDQWASGSHRAAGQRTHGGQVLGDAHVAEPLDAHVLDPDPLLLRQGPWIDESEDARGVRHPEGP